MRPVRDSLRSLWLLMALALAAFGLAAPAAAWDVHAAAHVGASVGIDQHHIHQADGSIQADQNTPSDNDPGDKVGGHDHMASAYVAMQGHASGLLPPLAASSVIGTRDVATLDDLKHPPPARPPSIR